jgi:hypothetical protein
LPITGIKRVFFLIGVTMTPVAILIAGWNHERAMWNSNGYAVIAWRENANPRLLPSNNLVSKSENRFRFRAGLAAGQECRSLLPGVQAT